MCQSLCFCLLLIIEDVHFYQHLNCSLNWQHQLCKNPRPNPDIKTLFVDHSCGQPNGARALSPVTNPLMGAVPKPGGFPPLSAHSVSEKYEGLGN